MSKGAVFYHLAHSNDRDSILREGLLPNSRNGDAIKYDKRICLFSNGDKPPFHVTGWNNMDIWEVLVDSNVKKDEFADPKSDWVYTDRKIPSTKLRLVKHVKTQEEAWNMWWD